MRRTSQIILAILAGWVCSASVLHPKVLAETGMNPRQPVLLASSITAKINHLSRQSRFSEPALLLLVGTTLIFTASKAPLFLPSRKRPKKLQMQEQKERKSEAMPLLSRAVQHREPLQLPEQEHRALGG